MTDESRQDNPGDKPVDPSFLDAVGNLADGTPVKWDAALAGTPDRDAALRQLQRLESLLSGHRTVARPADVPPVVDQPVLFTWGSLEVREKLGEGTFGEVFRAWDPRVGREVALKLRKPGASSKDTRRWLDEARRLARVRHPNVLVVYGADEHGGRAGIWTELLHGRTLEDRIRRDGPMGPREAALIGTDMCSALAAVHAAGLVHGDIKTTNIMREGAAFSETPPDLRSTPGGRGEAGRIVLMDFGTAVARSGAPGDDPVRLYATPLTAAPEVLDGKSASVASDIYSLAVVLYRLVTERYPIEASSLEDLRAAAKSGGWKSLRDVRPDLPAPFVQVIERALAPSPSHRFATAAEMERALAATLGAASASVSPPARRRSRPRTAWWVAGLALAAAAVILWRAGLFERDRAHVPWATASDAPVECRLVRTFSGLEMYSSFGFVLEMADINHDGFQDYLVGAPHASGGRFYGHFGGPNADETADLTLAGDDTADQFGRSICGSGDLNGDGLNDLVIGEARGRTGKGRVHVYLGTEPFDATPDLVLLGEDDYDHFGVDIEDLDFNADGFDDIVVGAYFNRENTGRAYLYLGGRFPDATADMVFAGEARGDGLSNSISHGDLNHDGYDDLVMGAYWSDAGGFDAGRVYVYHGGPAPDAIADFTFDGAAGDGFGNEASASGDYDGDGVVDLVVCAFSNSTGGYQAGAVYGFRGGTTMDRLPDFVLVGEKTGDQFGRTAVACDVSGDGFADVVVGAVDQDAGGPDAGRVYVFLGGREMSDAPAVVLTGNAKGDNFGTLLATPDVGDGRGALLVGAHNNDFSFADAGQAYLYTFEPRRRVGN